jgi:hypothetical protein
VMAGVLGRRHVDWTELGVDLVVKVEGEEAWHGLYLGGFSVGWGSRHKRLVFIILNGFDLILPCSCHGYSRSRSLPSMNAREEDPSRSPQAVSQRPPAITQSCPFLALSSPLCLEPPSPHQEPSRHPFLVTSLASTSAPLPPMSLVQFKRKLTASSARLPFHFPPSLPSAAKRRSSPSSRSSASPPSLSSLVVHPALTSRSQRETSRRP